MTDWANIQTITIPEIKPGMIFLLDGTATLSKGIQFFAKLKYGKNSPYFISHSGHFDEDIDSNLIVYEENYPGKYMPVRADIDYFNAKADVYVGSFITPYTPEQLVELRKQSEILSGSTKLLDYSYSSYPDFIVDSIWYKLFKKDIWITGEPNGRTCSQAEAWLAQIVANKLMKKEWYKYMPCDIAMSDEVTVRKLIY